MAESLLNQRRMLTRSLRDKEGNRIRGMGIRSAENARVEQDYMERAQRGVANMQMQQLRQEYARQMNETRGATDAAAPTMSASEQLAADRKSRMDYYARINGRPAAPAAGAPATGGTPATTPATTPTAGAPAATTPATTPTSTTVPSLTQSDFGMQRRSLLRQRQNELDTANAAESARMGMESRVLAGGSGAIEAERQRILGRSAAPTSTGSPKPTEPFAAERAAIAEAIAEARSSTQSLLRMPRPGAPAPEAAGPPQPPSMVGPMTPPTPMGPPKPAAGAAPAATQAARPRLLSARFVGNEPPVRQESPEDRARRMAEAKQKRFEQSSIPDWMEGTTAGSLLRNLQRPTL